MINRKLEEIVTADLDQTTVVEEPEFIKQNKEGFDGKEKEDIEMTKKIKLHESKEDGAEVARILYDLYFVPSAEDGCVYELNSGVHSFKCDFSNLDNIELTRDDMYHVVFESVDEFKKYIYKFMHKASNIDHVDTVDEDLETEIADVVDNSISVDGALNEDMETAQRESDEILKKANEESEAIMDAAREEEEKKNAELEKESKTAIITSNVKELIKHTWDIIENIQSGITVVKANSSDDDVEGVLHTILDDEMMHIGQLNGVLKYSLPGFDEATSEGEDKVDIEYDPTNIDAEIEKELDVDSTEAVKNDVDAEPTPIEADDIDEFKDEKITPTVDEKTTQQPEMLDDEPAPVDVTDEDLK